MTFETLLINPAVQSLGWALLHFVWQGSLLAALLLAANALTRRSQATLRYATACIVMLLMPVLFVATILRSKLFQPPASSAQHSRGVAVPGTDSEPAETAVLISGGTALPRSNASAWYKAAVLPGCAVCVWLVGVLGLSMYTACGWLRVQRLRRRGIEPADPVWISMLESLMRRLRMSWPVGLYASAVVQVPTVIGWVHPYVLLPISAITGLGETQMQAVLAHELAHIRRYDYLVNLLQNAVETLLFYHPAVWWVSRRIREERELCCDDMAVAVCGDVMVYAGALARLEELRGTSSEPALAATGGDLLARIRRLVGQQQRRDRIPGSIGVTLAVALLVAAVVGIGGAPQIRAQSAAAPTASLGQPAGEPPVFEIASVKVNADPDRLRGIGRLGQIQYSPDTLTMRGISLWMSVRWAYGVENFQISGPDWMQNSPVYDIVAKAPGPVPASQLRLMLRTLLAERFHLTVHQERKEMPVTALLAATGGPKFHESAGKYDPERGAEAPMRFLGYDDSVHVQRNQSRDGRLQDSYTNVSMKLFAAMLELASSRSGFDKVPVVDMTGLQGRFDFVVTLDRPGSVRSEGEGASADDPPLPPHDPLAAWKPILQKQLGLTLKPGKAMVDVIVVDHVNKEPTPN